MKCRIAVVRSSWGSPSSGPRIASAVITNTALWQPDDRVPPGIRAARAARLHRLATVDTPTFVHAASWVGRPGPETADAAFTWAEFVQRNNSELVAGWGNLVNRTANMIHKNFGEIPSPGELEDVDRAVLEQVRGGFATVGSLIERNRLKAALTETMRLVGEANRYVTVTEPFKLKGDDQRERLATVLHTLAQCVVDLNTMMAPFLPHSSNQVAAVFGIDDFMPMPRVDEVTDLDDEARSYPIITGDYQDAPTWGRHPVTVGTPVAKPTPVFTKLDESIVDAELARYAGSVPDDVTGS